MRTLLRERSSQSIEVLRSVCEQTPICVQRHIRIVLQTCEVTLFALKSEVGDYYFLRKSVTDRKLLPALPTPPLFPRTRAVASIYSSLNILLR